MHELLTTKPHLVNEWHPTKNGLNTPSQYFCNSTISVWWLCQDGHTFTQSIRDRATRMRGCPYCSGKKVTPEISFAGKHPDKIQLWHASKNGNLKPTEFAPKSNKINTL